MSGGDLALKIEKVEKLGISTQVFKLAKVKESWLLTKLLLKKGAQTNSKIGRLEKCAQYHAEQFN